MHMKSDDSLLFFIVIISYHERICDNRNKHERYSNANRRNNGCLPDVLKDVFKKLVAVAIAFLSVLFVFQNLFKHPYLSTYGVLFAYHI